MLTLADLEPLPETRVAVDNLLEHGFKPEAYAPDDCDAALHIKQRDVRPYEMVDRSGRPSLFGLETYEMWAGNSSSPPLTAERLARATREVFNPECPLCGCEDFAGQRLFPRHDPYGYAIPIGGPMPPGFTYLGAGIDPGADEHAAVILAAAINAPPRVLQFRNGSTLTIDPARVAPGDFVMLNGQRFSILELLEDPSPAYDLMELPRVELLPRTGAEMAAQSAREHLERARPRRRLDGRRAG